jgi:large conductance mechanosensitive channel
MQGFRKFVERGKVVDLAVAVVIGAAFGGLVNALVKDLVTPLIAAAGGQPDFSNIYFTINNSKFLIGDFINSAVSFLIVAGVVYFFIVLPSNKLAERLKPDDEGTENRECPHCTYQIPKQATRCPFCTSEVEKVA